MMSARTIIGAQSVRTAGLSRFVVGRGFSLSTSARLGLKESSSHDPDYEKHKIDSLKKQKDGAGHWKPELASDSEEAVKADRNPSTPNETAKLQEQTKKAAEETAKRGSSNVQSGM